MNRNENTSRPRPSLRSNHELQHPQTAGIQRKKWMVGASPYAVFVHSSSVYSTSDAPQRPQRPGLRPNTQYKRQLPYRPDPYPYADMKWSRLRRELLRRL